MDLILPRNIGPCLICLLSSLSSPCLLAEASALTTDPIQIQADHAEIDALAGIAIHRGQVVLSQADRQLTADEITVLRSPEGKIIQITATGRPVRYQGALRHGRPSVQGEADCVLYFPQEPRLVLEGHARLSQEQDLFTGPRLEYQPLQKRISSTLNADGRTTLILQPR